MRKINFLYNYRSKNDNKQLIFEKSMIEILTLILNLMHNDSDSAHFLHGVCFKYVSQSISDITTVFSSTLSR